MNNWRRSIGCAQQDLDCSIRGNPVQQQPVRCRQDGRIMFSVIRGRSDLR